MTEKTYLEPKKPRYHRIDGWRGYTNPALAVAGTSYTGEWDDSPCKGVDVRAELARIRKEVLRPLGIKSRVRQGSSSNVFCAKLWLCVAREDFHKAALVVTEWLENNKHTTSYVHDAELAQLGY